MAPISAPGDHENGSLVRMPRRFPSLEQPHSTFQERKQESAVRLTSQSKIASLRFPSWSGFGQGSLKKFQRIWKADWCIVAPVAGRGIFRGLF
jgi:hypothetical protein